MHDTVIKRVLVWSGWFRLSHASIALTTPALLLTGWLIANSPSLAASALDLHYLLASFLVFGLLIRIVLLFAGREHERLPGLFPAVSELNAMAKTLGFYISLGRSSMPGWYAQNPFWKPFYLVTYLALIILATTGALLPGTSILSGFYLPSVHAFWAHIVLWFSVLHIASVLMHDYRNQTSDISAMVNGYRLFLIEGGQDGTGADKTVQFIAPGSLKSRD